VSKDDKAPYNPFTRPKFAALERLVCSYLIESLTVTGLQSVVFICRAALLLSESEIEKLNLDMKAISSIYTVAERLEAAKTIKDGDRTYSVHLQTLDWEYDIAPWIKSRLYPFYPFGIDVEELEKESIETSVFTVISRLSYTGYRALTSDFLQMATPFAQTLGGMLTALISPETYTDMLQTYKGVKNA